MHGEGIHAVRSPLQRVLATFADMQQRYPGLLGPYRPMVQKANLGSKGTWYRLRIGPKIGSGKHWGKRPTRERLPWCRCDLDARSAHRCH